MKRLFGLNKAMGHNCRRCHTKCDCSYGFFIGSEGYLGCCACTDCNGRTSALPARVRQFLLDLAAGWPMAVGMLALAALFAAPVLMPITAACYLIASVYSLAAIALVVALTAAVGHDRRAWKRLEAESREPK
jgi:hypothetical protein